MPKNLFSIVIPTRQRHDTLRYSIQSVLNQTYKNFELVVMDNFSSKETYEVVSSFDDPRIKYYRSPERLRMTDNWELGLSHASGEYITFIGDDDALLPDALDRCFILLNQYNVKIVTWYRWPYFWPNASAIQQRNQLFIPLEQGVAVWNSKEKLKLCYQSQLTYEYLPMLYNSFISREIIEKVKSVRGTYFSSRAVSPDLCSGIVNAYFSDSYLFSSRFFSLSGISKHSIGMSSITLSSNSKDSTPADEFIKEHNTEITHKNLITSSHFRIIMASDFLFTKDAFFPDDTEIKLNVRGLLAIMASTINNDPDNHSKSYENTLEGIKKLALKYGISLQELHIPPEIAVQKRTKVHHGPMRDSSGNISGLIVDCKKAGITDAAHAAMLAYSLMEGESVVAENEQVKNDWDIKLKESQKSKVLLVSLPGLNTSCVPIFPLGIGYLLSAIRQDRTVKAVHYQVFEHATQQLPEIISAFQPEIVGLTCSTFNRGNVRTICTWLRKNHPYIKIILGGVHVSFLAEQALRDYGADCVVIGEGELTFRELCDALDKDITLAGVKGIAFLDGEKLVTTEPREVVRNLDDLPMPDYSFAGDIMRKSGMGFVISSRGCPVQCNFCSTSSYWGQKVRTNSPRRVVDEMEALIATYGVKKIFFHDDTFNLGIVRVREICTEITSRGLNVEWGVSCRVNPVSQEMIDMMVAAGCRHICWGIESGSKVMLERIDKKITQEQISNAFALCRKHLGTISIGAFTMVGNPGESETTIAESIQFINTLHMTDQPSTAILYILPGTKLYAELLINYPELERYWMESSDVLYYTLENSMDKLIGWASQISKSGTIVSFDRNKHFWDNVLSGDIPQPTMPYLSFCTSELNHVIPPEIKDDEFYYLIQKLAREEEIHTVLEIGSSAGGGSTEAFVTGLAENPCTPNLFCMEVSQPRFAELKQRYADMIFVRCYNTSSVSLSKFASLTDVESFYNSTRTNLNNYSLHQVFGWLQQDLDYVQRSGLDEDGIARICKENGIAQFDMVLIDGSEFTGKSELDEVYGARWLLLDDINAFKNFENYQRLKHDPAYEIYSENWQVRNGYAIFKKREAELPIHFFTIVLNGMPFIKYHIDILQHLPFKWHWHIVEGVADLVNDTAWSKQLGGHISEEFHNNCLSIDGTTNYLDQLKRQFPDQISIYRKTNGCFWEGKLEMVNAPVSSIREECLLWQVDVDEYWTSEQIVSARNLFAQNPEKTAAFYWCHFFVGKELVVNSRNCYSQNPAQEWLRTWRYTPGCRWVAHEPPRLHCPLPNGPSVDIAGINPFSHNETEQNGLVFQHFAYVLPEQLRFKELYYGYKGALTHWLKLQDQKNFPVYLRDYFPWVGDDTTVAFAADNGVVPLSIPLELTTFEPKVIVDGIFFQIAETGIARLWSALLVEWSKSDFAPSIILLDRAGTAPQLPGIRTRVIPAYDYNATDKDREMLQTICDEEGADLFVSTYYTTPLTTPSVFYAYDMIPENTPFFDLNNPSWREKHYGITHAAAYIAISRYTAMDLVKAYPPAENKITIAYPAVDTDVFAPALEYEVGQFRTKYGITKPYLLFVGQRQTYKNAKLLFEGFARVKDNTNLDIMCVGGLPALEPYLSQLVPNCTVHILQLADSELRLAYSGAVAFVYPSLYEGFGLPILEAMACGCPVITCQNSSILEVAGAAALYVASNSPEEMAASIQNIQEPAIRSHLIKMGKRQVNKFSWSKMADEVRDALVKTYEAERARP